MMNFILILLCSNQRRRIGTFLSRCLLNRGPRHASAFLSTAPTSFGAMLAVVVLVSLTCFGASVADFGTALTNLGSELRPATHEGHGRQANLRTVAIEPNAVRHFGDVGLFQASVKAMIARGRALHASVDTTLMFMVAHRSSPMRKG